MRDHMKQMSALAVFAALGIGATGCAYSDSDSGAASGSSSDSGSVSGAPALGGTGAHNEPGYDYQTGVPSSTFASSMTLSPSALDSLRQMARDQGTYYSGATTFNLPPGSSFTRRPCRVPLARSLRPRA